MRPLRPAILALVALFLINPAGAQYGDISDVKLTKPEDKVDVKSTPAPRNAMVLFDGRNLDAWAARGGGAPGWKVVDGGILEAAAGSDLFTRKNFGGDIHLHLEFRVPYLPKANALARGNSGVFLQGRHEIQILDSYGVPTDDQQCGSIYGAVAPRVNACKAPTVWQSLDIWYYPAKCEGGKKLEPAYFTVSLNGVRIHDRQVVMADRTTGGREGDPCAPGPIVLQYHGSPVQFRNIWMVPTLPLSARMLTQKIKVEPLGDARVHMQWDMPLAVYRQFQKMLAVPEGKNFAPATPEGAISFLDLNNLWIRAESPQGAFDDARHHFSVDFQLKGWARPTANHSWFVELLDDGRWREPLFADRSIRYILPPRSDLLHYRLVSLHGAHAILEAQTSAFLQRIEIELPTGASKVFLVTRGNGRQALSYVLPAPTLKPSEEPAGDESPLRVFLEPRREIVPVLHKLYADARWPTLHVARIRMENRGADPLAIVRVRYRFNIPGCQKDLSDPVDVASVIYPGQTVAHSIYPILDPNICRLRSKSVGECVLEYSYKRPDGKRMVGLRKAKLTVLGVNDAPMTDLEVTAATVRHFSWGHVAHEMPLLLGSFVHPDDPVIRDLKGQVSKAVSGVPPQQEPERYLEALYNVYRANIAYTTPSGEDTKGGRPFQHLYYGRDVLRTKSGTCIDLAILFASVAESAGLDACLVLLPGHCFPAVVVQRKTKDGAIVDELMGVETTGCQGGQWHKSASYALVRREGDRKVAEVRKTLQYTVIRMSDLRGLGVTPPELPGSDLPANPLDAWKLLMPPAKPRAQILAVRQEKNVTVNDQKGARFSIDYVVHDGKARGLAVYLIVFDGNKIATDRGGREILVTHNINPASNVPEKTTATLFIPYERMTDRLAEGQTKEFRYVINLRSAVFDNEWIAEKPWIQTFKLGR